MKNLAAFICLTAIILGLNGVALADFKLRQQITINAGGSGFTRESAVWVKGMRQRSEGKIILEDEQQRQMMEQMMPPIAEVLQCDLKQTLKINDRTKRYFIEPFYVSEDKPLPSVQPSTTTEVKRGGTVNWTYTLTDTGERRQMFGLTARRLKIKQLTETSKDSCGGESKMSMEEEGWYVYLIPENADCQIELPRGESKKSEKTCRDRLVMKGAYRYPGFMLEGTTKITDLLKNDSMTTAVKTLELSKATLEMSLFDIPVGYTEVNSEMSLNSMGGIGNFPVGGMVSGGGNRQSNKKAVAIDFFSGNVSKINQDNLRRFIAEKVSANGANPTLITSQNEISGGAYQNVIGVEIKSVKESGASKIGGLFGRVTGNESASKIGQSEAEVVVTLYAQDGKTVVATGTAKEKADGKADDAARAAIEKALMQILPGLK